MKRLLSAIALVSLGYGLWLIWHPLMFLFVGLCCGALVKTINEQERKPEAQIPRPLKQHYDVPSEVDRLYPRDHKLQ